MTATFVHDLGRNDACHCGSGRKYKRCCLDKDEAAAQAARTKAEADAPAEAPPDPAAGKPVQQQPAQAAELPALETVGDQHAQLPAHEYAAQGRGELSRPSPP